MSRTKVAFEVDQEHRSLVSYFVPWLCPLYITAEGCEALVTSITEVETDKRWRVEAMFMDEPTALIAKLQATE